MAKSETISEMMFVMGLLIVGLKLAADIKGLKDKVENTTITVAKHAS
jgi:hypothetical protein